MDPAADTHPRPRALLIAALALLAALATALVPGPAAAGEIATVPAPTAGDARSYWTPERMRAAVPLEMPAPAGIPSPPGAVPLAAPASAGPPTAVGPLAPGSSEVAVLERERLGGAEMLRADPPVDRREVQDPSVVPLRSHGKVFLTITGGDSPGNYVCSGTAVSSNNRSVVWTAGHCVFDDLGGGYATNLTFVPAYRDGDAPFGEWPATKLAAPTEWQQEGNLSYDLGAAVVARNAEGRALGEVVGGRGIAFNQARSQDYTSFGYPAQQPPLEFTGGRMFRCDSPLGGSDNPPGGGPATSWISCDMNGGSSGGGWVAHNKVLSINSYSYCVAGLVCEERLYGPYQADTARELYESVTGKAQLCAGEIVTILGTGGDDVLAGTEGADVIKAGDGDDRVDGKGGRDRICGGNGADRLSGGAGGDRLKGQAGKDALIGGSGRDRCNGGPGRDTARSCKKVSKVP